MTLSTGTKLSHYEINSQIGKGGMGEVYQAKDQKLGRDVAIKVLPQEFAQNTDRVARFHKWRTQPAMVPGQPGNILPERRRGYGGRYDYGTGTQTGSTQRAFSR